jgi:raffinose/stachyose/melibiose transport system permease protein
MNDPKKLVIQKSILHFLFISAILLIFLPLLWIFISSLKTNSEMYIAPMGLPEKLHFSNYGHAWELGLSNYFLNSILISAASILVTLLLGGFCAYGLARFEFRGKDLLFYLIVGGLLLSPQSGVLALYKIIKSLHVMNTRMALIFPYIGIRLPFAIFLMRSYFLSFPKDIEESARIDGSGVLSTYTRIVVPITRPIFASTAIMTAIFVWNEFLFALVFISDERLMTIPIGLSNFRDALITDYPPLLASILVGSLPLILLFLISSKSFISGLTAGSVKG